LLTKQGEKKNARLFNIRKRTGEFSKEPKLKKLAQKNTSPHPPKSWGRVRDRVEHEPGSLR